MVKIRLARMGRRKLPFYRVVVADASAPRDGKFKEIVGTYDPLINSDIKGKVKFKADRISYWISVGAQPTKRVKTLMEHMNLV